MTMFVNVPHNGIKHKVAIASANGHCTASQESDMMNHSVYTNQPKISS